MYYACMHVLLCLCVCVILFFFFKQNTAYEMRISDWSSDVCSSDLARGHQEFAGFTRRDQLVDEAAIVVEIGVRLRNRVLLLFHRRQIDDVGRHLAVDDLAIRGFDEAIFVHARKGREAVDRSEKHTSELQSLMRNSYAVFCLK